MTNKEDCYEQALQDIIDLGFDYDGEYTLDGFKSLVKELVAIARAGLKERRPQYIRGNQVYEKVLGKEQIVPEENWNDSTKQYFQIQLNIKRRKYDMSSL